jgi:hypothetical protein
LTTARLGGVVHRGLGDGRGLMNLRRTVALSDVVVALTASFFKIKKLICSKDAFAEDGGGDF